jgi:hypothetical protein
MADRTQWYYASGEERKGPVSSAVLKTLATSGQLGPEDLVWREGMSDWTAARLLRGLFSGSPSSSNIEPPSGINTGMGSSPSQIVRQRVAKNGQTWRYVQIVAWCIAAVAVVICLLGFLTSWGKAEGSSAKVSVAAFYGFFVVAAVAAARAMQGLAELLGPNR